MTTITIEPQTEALLKAIVGNAQADSETGDKMAAEATLINVRFALVELGMTKNESRLKIIELLK